MLGKEIKTCGKELEACNRRHGYFPIDQFGAVDDTELRSGIVTWIDKITGQTRYG
jgi:hypothetical protein